jgi:positive regulator of sigma E activity
MDKISTSLCFFAVGFFLPRVFFANHPGEGDIVGLILMLSLGVLSLRDSRRKSERRFQQQMEIIERLQASNRSVKRSCDKLEIFP